VQQRRFCALDGSEVAYSDIAKGFENADGTMTVLTADDMARLPLPTAKTMEVLQFVDPAKVDPLMFGKAYYALPASPVAGNAFALLTLAMRQRRVSGLVKVALRQRESLGLLSERDGALVLTLLLWPDEVREAPTPATSSTSVIDAAIDQAVSLIDVMTAPFVPGDYTDDYTEAVAELVAAKVAGRDVLPAPAGDHGGPPADLSDMLRASVAAAKAKRSPAKAPARKGGKK
jgi:DNA end-binding protein Ku